MNQKLVDALSRAMDDPDDPERQNEVAERLMAYAAQLRAAQEANEPSDFGGDQAVEERSSS